MKKTVAVLTLILSGCASSPDFVEAQMKMQKLQMESQKPLVEITAVEGQPITGLAGLKVYMPQQQVQLQQPRSEWAGVASQALGVAGTVLGIHYAGQAAVNLANSVGTGNAAIAGHIQAPGAVTTTTTTSTLSGTGTLGGGSYSTVDSTHVPTVVNQPNPTVVQPVVVTPPPGKICTVSATGTLTCN